MWKIKYRALPSKLGVKEEGADEVDEGTLDA